MRTIIRSAALLGVVALTSAANAELLNIDLSATGAAGPTPAATYGAAANQPGFWNNFTTATVANAPLNDLAGNPTGATLSLTAGGFMFDAVNSNPNGVVTTAGSDDELLMDDVWDSPAAAQITVGNLAAGAYSVVMYGGSPDSATTFMNFVINGDSKFVGGQWSTPFSYQEGITHATFAVNHAGGALIIDVPDVAGFESVNGLQIAQVPEPMSAALLAVGAVTMTMRRRRR